MQAYQKRVVAERAELMDKISKLWEFFDIPIFSTLSVAEQARLLRQYRHMCNYVGVLDERIAAFKQES